MGKSKHTDGEWNYRKGVGCPPHIRQTYHDSQKRRCHRMIAEVLVTSGREEETDAIGHLLSAAPDMLEALTHVIQFYPERHPWWCKKKADGLGECNCFIDIAKAAIAKATP